MSNMEEDAITALALLFDLSDRLEGAEKEKAQRLLRTLEAERNRLKAACLDCQEELDRAKAKLFDMREAREKSPDRELSNSLKGIIIPEQELSREKNDMHETLEIPIGGTVLLPESKERGRVPHPYMHWCAICLEVFFSAEENPPKCRRCKLQDWNDPEAAIVARRTLEKRKQKAKSKIDTRMSNESSGIR